MGMAGLWHFSQVSLVYRERTTIDLDSPRNSASIDLCSVPRQMKGTLLWVVCHGLLSGFLRFDEFFDIVTVIIRLPRENE
jgi:hypothetical protein